MADNAITQYVSTHTGTEIDTAVDKITAIQSDLEDDSTLGNTTIKAVRKNLSELNSKVLKLSTNSNTIDQNFETIKANINHNQQAISGVNQALITLQNGNVKDNTDKIKILEKSVGDKVAQEEYKHRTEAIIGSKTELTNNELENKDMTLSKLRSAIDATNKKIPLNLIQTFPDCLDTVQSHTTKISSLEERASDLEDKASKIDSNTRSVNRLEEALNSQQGVITQNQGKISTIQGNVSTIQENYITKNDFNFQIEALNSQIGTLSSQIEALNSEIENLKSRVSTLESSSS